MAFSYYDMLQRTNGADLDSHPGGAPRKSALAPNLAPLSVPILMPLLPKPTLQAAKLRDLQILNERVAPLVAVGRSVRVLLTGCRPGDGVSTIAMAMALDMSARLSVPTLLVDGHLDKPDLHRLFPPMPNVAPPMVLGDQFVVRSTGLPRLELATLLPRADSSRPAIESWDSLLEDYRLTFVDLGVVRLDSRLLALARPSDPVIVIVRYQHTAREELATTTVALSAAGRKPTGVVMNAVAQHPIAPKRWRDFFLRRSK